MSRRDYASQKSHNYKVPRKTIRRDKLKREVWRKRFLISLALVIIVGLIICGMYWVFYSRFFLINQITIMGSMGETHEQLMHYTQDNLSGHKLLVFPKRNYFLFDETSLLIQLQNTDNFDPPINNLSVTKVWPNKLIVKFTQRVARFKVVAIQNKKIVDENQLPQIEISQEYLIDTQGVIVQDQAFVSPGSVESALGLSEIHVLTDQIEYQLGDQILKPDTISLIQRISQQFLTSNLPKIKWFEIVPNDLAMTVVTDHNYKIYFGLNYALQLQIDNLILIFKKIGDRLDKLQYIDFRIKNRAYACCNLGEL